MAAFWAEMKKPVYSMAGSTSRSLGVRIRRVRTKDRGRWGNGAKQMGNRRITQARGRRKKGLRTAGIQLIYVRAGSRACALRLPRGHSGKCSPRALPGSAPEPSLIEDYRRFHLGHRKLDLHPRPAGGPCGLDLRPEHPGMPEGVSRCWLGGLLECIICLVG